ncbi:MAG: hypothetical protein HZA54_00260, partial [Planctomycetes bacterium]|nr:hypothetical protein [Planctomycetota bacterium]
MAAEAAVVALLIMAGIKSQRARSPLGLWKAAAAELGLTFEMRKAFLGKYCVLVGTIEGCDVEVRMGDMSTKAPQPAVVVTVGRKDLPGGLRLSKENLATGLGKVVQGADVEVGSAWFDKEVLVWGDEAETVAVLDEATRKQVLRFVAARGGEVRDRRLTLMLTVAEGSLRPAIGAVRELVELAGRLAVGARPVPTRLRENATGDSAAAVRRRNFETLLKYFPEHAETRAAGLALLRDADPEMRLAGARAAGEAGWKVLQELAESPECALPIRVGALGLMIATVPAERLGPMLELAALSAEPMVAGAAMGALAGMRDPRIVARIAQWGVRLAGTAAEAASRLLVELRVPGAESVLLVLLGHADMRARVAAARALGAV